MTEYSLKWYCGECTLFKRKLKKGESPDPSKKLKCRKCTHRTYHFASSAKIRLSTVEFDFS